jgi:hypothetical protein
MPLNSPPVAADVRRRTERLIASANPPSYVGGYFPLERAPLAISRCAPGHGVIW